MTLIFATHNPNKVKEVASLLKDINIITLEEAGFHEEIPEPYDTLKENAHTKSATIFEKTGKDCFSEDTGLEVAVLDGAPGAKSARYAGEQKSAADNINKLLRELEEKDNRKARFRTVISLFLKEKEYYFEGACEGEILKAPRDEGGFGYDPVFLPSGSDRCFAEMTLAEKNKYSHRAKAFRQLVDFLKRVKGGK